jgi:hypothetical protein
MWEDRNIIAENWQHSFMKFRDLGYGQDDACRIANKCSKSFENRFWLKEGNRVYIEVHEAWKRHYTETEKSGIVISKTEDRITILGDSGSPSRYIIGTFTIYKIWYEE